jgi:hypothetical protein
MVIREPASKDPMNMGWLEKSDHQQTDILQQCRTSSNAQKQQSTFFKITTALQPRRHCKADENEKMKNEIRLISGFLALNIMIISLVVHLSMRGGIKFERILGQLLN